MTGAPNVAAGRPVAVAQAPGGARRAATCVVLRHGAAAAPAELGEGPVWDAAAGSSIWVDVDRGLVHRRACGRADVTRRPWASRWAAPFRAPAGGLALALRDGFALVPPGGGEPQLVAARGA